MKIIRFLFIYSFLLFAGNVAQAQQEQKFGPFGGTGGYNFDVKANNQSVICEILIHEGFGSNLTERRIVGLDVFICPLGQAKWKYQALDLGRDINSPRRILGAPRSAIIQASRVRGAPRVRSLRIDPAFLNSPALDSRVAGQLGAFISGTDASMQIVGLFGSFGDELDSIGFYFRGHGSLKIEPLTLSPFINPALAGVPGPFGAGGFGGFPFRQSNNICGARVRHGSRIDAIQFILCTGGVSPRFGGSGGVTSEFRWNPGELETIKGWRGNRRDSDRIFGLQFETKNGKSAVFGRVTSDPFEFAVGSNAGVCGRAAGELDAIWPCN